MRWQTCESVVLKLVKLIFGKMWLLLSSAFCYSHHQTSGWVIKTKVVVWKPICQEFCFKLHRQTFTFCCKKFDRKVWCEIFFHNLVCRLSLLFLWWRGLVIRNIFTKQTYGLCPTYKMASRTQKRHIKYWKDILPKYHTQS